jgi:hypothetical protein
LAKASPSFLKKRSKKLVFLRLWRQYDANETAQSSRNKSFLVSPSRAQLFFKEELLAFSSRLPCGRLQAACSA